MKQDKQVSTARRQFLQQAVTGSGAAAAAATLPGAVAAQSGPVQDEPQRKGYRLSQHVVDYYRSAAE